MGQYRYQPDDDASGLLMKPFYSVLETLRTLGITQKTLRAWSEELGIWPQRHPRDRRKWVYTPKQIRAIAKAKEVTLGQVPATWDDVLTELEALRIRVANLEARTGTVYRPAEMANQTLAEPIETRPRAHTTRLPPLPPDLVSLQAFGELHTIPDSTTDKAVKEGRLPVVRGSWAVHRGIVRQALDQKGRQAFYELWGDKKRFTRCTDCPKKPEEEHK